jgi:hypothetical protein
MKTIFALIILSAAFETFAQQADWVYLGKEIGYEFYYKKSTIIRGDKPFVVIIGVPLTEMKDEYNNVIKYLSANVIFYDSPTGIRCMITNHIFYFEDKTYRKAGFPKRDLPLMYYNLLVTLYNAIR